ncbi:MAG: hypothetical protein RB148_09475 [Armatimonadota bacterium]|nr:hypothetical protein [Armatimonadota bacterium]
MAYRAQQQWETWRKRLAPQDVPKSVGLGVYPDLPRAYQGPTSDIVLYEAARHPLVHQGTFYMPRPERERLLRLVDAGVDLPILVLDELPAGSVRRYGLDAITRHTQFFLPPPAHSTLDLNERLGRRAAFLNRAFGLAADGLAVAAAVALAPFMLLGLDPAVLGVISPRPDPRPGDPVFVFLLSAWRW